MIKRISIKTLLVILITLAVCLIIFNQLMSMYYKVELLLEPCSLCEKINKDTKCVYQPNFLINISEILKDINFTNSTASPSS